MKTTVLYENWDNVWYIHDVDVWLEEFIVESFDWNTYKIFRIEDNIKIDATVFPEEISHDKYTVISNMIDWANVWIKNNKKSCEEMIEKYIKDNKESLSKYILTQEEMISKLNKLLESLPPTPTEWH